MLQRQGSHPADPVSHNPWGWAELGRAGLCPGLSLLKNRKETDALLWKYSHGVKMSEKDVVSKSCLTIVFVPH